MKEIVVSSQSDDEEASKVITHKTHEDEEENKIDDVRIQDETKTATEEISTTENPIEMQSDINNETKNGDSNQKIEES